MFFGKKKTHFVETSPREAALEKLRKSDPNYFPDALRLEISYLYEQGEIDDIDIELALDAALLTEARFIYGQLITGTGPTKYPDHINHPEFLAYGIKNEALTKEEMDQIPFDHGETPD